MNSNKKSYTKSIYKLLEKEFGVVHCPLHYRKDYELCIAVILSAQCTDERVNMVTPTLFQNYPTLRSFAEAKQEDIEKLIYSTGFYKNKAKSILGFANKLYNELNSKLPKTIEDLTKLPGVGRKTANVILNEIFQISEGIVVDTHVKRISNVLNLTGEKDPVKIEKELMERFDPEHWMNISLYMIFLGRKYCTAFKRHCGECPLTKICPSSGIKK
ncbi:MAG: endonuclease III [Leptospiraceae bacterium]|nr:endonuclease III [Leptospiraceae bacterium]